MPRQETFDKAANYKALLSELEVKIEHKKKLETSGKTLKSVTFVQQPLIHFAIWYPQKSDTMMNSVSYSMHLICHLIEFPM